MMVSLLRQWTRAPTKAGQKWQRRRGHCFRPKFNLCFFLSLGDPSFFWGRIFLICEWVYIYIYVCISYIDLCEYRYQGMYPGLQWLPVVWDEYHVARRSCRFNLTGTPRTRAGRIQFFGVFQVSIGMFFVFFKAVKFSQFYFHRNLHSGTLT